MEHAGPYLTLSSLDVLTHSTGVQHAYKAYRDVETKMPAPLDEVISDLSVMFIAGESGAVYEEFPDHY